MKILITGAAGGIGSTLGYHLHKKGHDLILVDNLRNGYLENLKIDGETFGNFYRIDINSEDFRSLVAKEIPDVIIHLAAITSLPDCEVNYRECIRTNVEGTAAVIGVAREFGVKRVIFASTSAVYENTKLDENQGFKESDDINPRLFYSLSKKMSEEICRSFIENYGMDILILRFFNVFGPRQDIHRKSPPLINYIVRELKNGKSPILHSDGNQARDYVYIDDVVDLIEKCLISEKNEQFIFNVSSNNLITVKEIVSSIRESIPKYDSIKEKYRDSSKLWDSYPELFEGPFPLKKKVVERETNKGSLGNNMIARSTLGWTPNINIRKIIIEIVKKIKI
jgi:nucleoside-diphosphate-sugar epimerase